MTTFVARIQARTRIPSQLHILATPGVLLCFLLLLTTVCYWGTLHIFFVQDDFGCLYSAGQPIPNLDMIRGCGFFRPLSTYWLTLGNMTVWGLEPFWHHFTLLVIFLATIAVLFYWLKNITNSTPAAITGASLYAFSKTHLFTLGWIVGGIDILAALFFVLGLWAADVYLKRADADDNRSGRKLLWVIVIAFSCGLLCKESCIIFMPACLTWIAARKLLAGRPFTPAEWKLSALLTAVVVVYLPLWKMFSAVVGTTAAGMNFDLNRGIKVLEDSVIAVIPAASNSIPRSSWWLMTVPMLAAVAIYCRRENNRYMGHIVLGLMLWVLPASIFIFTRYPWILQLYYAHFSVFGLVLLAALAIEAIQYRMSSRRDSSQSSADREYPTAFRLWPRLFVGLSVLVFGAWIGFASNTIWTGVRDRASPALHLAAYARRAYEQIAPHLQYSRYREVVFQGLSEKMWASIYYGEMVKVFFPGVEIMSDNCEDCLMPPQLKTTSTILVVRQTGDKTFTIVR